MNPEILPEAVEFNIYIRWTLIDEIMQIVTNCSSMGIVLKLEWMTVG